MSRVTVQCTGSGRPANVGFAKRANCPVCGFQQDVRSDGKLRKHMRRTTTAALRRGSR